MITRRSMARMFIYAELALLGIWYLLGPQGVPAITKLQDECLHEEQLLVSLKVEVAELEREILRWESDPFFKEKIAREQLQLVRSGDEVYYV
jgi:cell division protein FtsB